MTPITLGIDLTLLEARVLFHLVNDLTPERLLLVLPHRAEQLAAQSAIQKLREFVYKGKPIT